MRRPLAKVALAVMLAVVATFGFLVYVLLASGDADYWRAEIAEYERRDVSNPPPPDAVLFLGGRDMRLWPRLDLDMRPVKVINRGFGGAQIAHVTHYISRIVVPYKPRAIVLMAGEADLADVHGRRPEDVLDDFKNFVAELRARKINVPVYFVSIHPSPMRATRWFGGQRANALVKDFIRRDPSLHYIEAADGIVDARGDVRRNLFRWDGLTLNQQGYQVLSAEIKPALLAAGLGKARRP